MRGQGGASDSCADHQHVSLAANSMFSLRLLCLPGASHGSRAGNLLALAWGGTAVTKGACLLPSPGPPGTSGIPLRFCASALPTPGSSLQALGKWKGPPALGHLGAPAFQAQCSMNLLSPRRTKSGSFCTDWVSWTSGTGASPPSDYTPTPSCNPVTSPRPPRDTSHAWSRTDPSPSGPITPELSLARLVENPAHSLRGFPPLAGLQPLTVHGLPKSSLPYSPPWGEDSSVWLCPQSLAWCPRTGAFTAALASLLLGSASA